MSAYRNRWIEVLKECQIPGWEIDIHGQAIVIRVPDTDREAVRKQALATISELTPRIGIPAEWLKFVFYNEKMHFEHTLNPELKA